MTTPDKTPSAEEAEAALGLLVGAYRGGERETSAVGIAIALLITFIAAHKGDGDGD